MTDRYVIGDGWTWTHWTFRGARRRRELIWRHIRPENRDRLTVSIHRQGRFKWVVTIEATVIV
jgi:hypothetical protein